MEKIMKIEGMMCEHCKKSVIDALLAVENVTNAEISLENGTATVTLNKDIADEVLKNAIEDIGFTVKEIK